eukprot:356868-Chlamydomonas_euryale.AAC.1
MRCSQLSVEQAIRNQTGPLPWSFGRNMVPWVAEEAGMPRVSAQRAPHPLADPHQSTGAVGPFPFHPPPHITSPAPTPAPPPAMLFPVVQAHSASHAPPPPLPPLPASQLWLHHPASARRHQHDGRGGSITSALLAQHQHRDWAAKRAAAQPAEPARAGEGPLQGGPTWDGRHR